MKRVIRLSSLSEIIFRKLLVCEHGWEYQYQMSINKLLPDSQYSTQCYQPASAYRNHDIRIESSSAGDGSPESTLLGVYNLQNPQRLEKILIPLRQYLKMNYLVIIYICIK